jgi:cation:H+ antiporter
MVLDVVYTLAGLALLAFAADHLVLGSARLAGQLRVNPVVVGVVVIGLGTSAPEFLVSGLAAARGDAGIAVGNLVGSNILNLTLLLGVAAVIAPIPVASPIVRREAPLSVAAIILFGLLAIVGLAVPAAVVLAVGAVAAIWLMVRWARDGRSEPELTGETLEHLAPGDPGPVRRAWLEPVRAVLGLAGVLAGAQLLVGGASSIAEGFGVPQVVIGFTLVALGTSLPELVTSIQAQRRGEPDLVIGNLLGSNLFNSLIGGAVIGFAGQGGPFRAAVPVTVAMVLSAVLAWALLRRGYLLTRAEGVLLLLAYVLMAPLLLSS